MRDRIDWCLLIISIGALGLSALVLATDARAQNTTPPAAADDRAAAMAAMRARQNATPDTAGTGRYPALKEESASLPDHVIYRPANLGKLGARKLGVYVFGYGACSNDGASARLHHGSRLGRVRTWSTPRLPHRRGTRPRPMRSRRPRRRPRT